MSATADRLTKERPMPTNERLPTAERLPPDGCELGPGWEVGGGFCCTCRHWKEESVYRHDPLKRGDADASCGRVECAIAMGAIVRKAEAPTTRDCGHGLRNCLTCAWNAGRPAEEHLAGTAETPPEQPSGNPGESATCGIHGHPFPCQDCDREPAEAPAAPAGEPSEARHLAHAFVTANRLDCEKERPSPEPRPEHFPLCDRLTDVIQRAIDPRDARIAALEAEVGARLVERDGWMEAAAKSETEFAEAKARRDEYFRLCEAERIAAVADARKDERQKASAAVQAERERCLGWWDWWWDRPDVTGNDFEDRIKNGDPAP